jgi:hypothetical protein
MRKIVRRQPLDRSRDRSIAAILAIAALAVPSIAVADEGIYCVRVPPGQSIRLKVPPSDPNEPAPIIVDQIGPDVGGVGVALLGAPEAGGTALIGGASAVIRTVSPSEAPELPSDPVVAVTITVPDQAPAGATVNLTSGGGGLSDSGALASTCEADVAGQFGAATPPAVSISDVLPGGGVLPAGTRVAVVGTGFQPDAQVLIEGVTLASTSWVDSSRIEVVTAVDMQLDARMVSVTNPDLTSATAYASLRATNLGESAIPLLAATEAIFPARTRSSAVFAAPGTGTFFALALQNPGPDDSIVSIELWDAEAGSPVASATLTLPSLTKVSREVSELFPGVIPSSGSVLAVTATVPVQMLGISGNEDDGSATPVLPALATP